MENGLHVTFFLNKYERFKDENDIEKYFLKKFEFTFHTH